MRAMVELLRTCCQVSIRRASQLLPGPRSTKNVALDLSVEQFLLFDRFPIKADLVNPSRFFL
jgi:hypothetical protein